jgi:hypothetical protein
VVEGIEAAWEEVPRQRWSCLERGDSQTGYARLRLVSVEVFFWKRSRVLFRFHLHLIL